MKLTTLIYKVHIFQSWLNFPTFPKLLLRSEQEKGKKKNEERINPVIQIPQTSYEALGKKLDFAMNLES